MWHTLQYMIDIDWNTNIHICNSMYLYDTLPWWLEFCWYEGFVMLWCLWHSLPVGSTCIPVLPIGSLEHETSWSDITKSAKSSFTESEFLATLEVMVSDVLQENSVSKFQAPSLTDHHQIAKKQAVNQVTSMCSFLWSAPPRGSIIWCPSGPPGMGVGWFLLDRVESSWIWSWWPTESCKVLHLWCWLVNEVSKQIQSSENSSNHVQTLVAWVPKHPPSHKVATVRKRFGGLPKTVGSRCKLTPGNLAKFQSAEWNGRFGWSSDAISYSLTLAAVKSLQFIALPKEPTELLQVIPCKFCFHCRFFGEDKESCPEMGWSVGAGGGLVQRKDINQ